MKVVFAERAKRDIGDTYDSIAQHNPRAAKRVEDAIRARCEGLADYPYAAGSPSFATGIRFSIA